MADTTDMAPTRADATRPAVKRSSSTRSRSRRRDDDLELQIERLQQDLKAIASSVTQLAERKVGEAQGRAETEVRNLVKGGQQAMEELQDEFSDVERQLKQTIRRKPLTAVAGAMALGFVLALITR